MAIYRGISVMQGDMKYTADYIALGEPGYYAARALFDEVK